MNCKQGDVAIVVGATNYSGLIVDVLYLAPPVEFQLPDGVWHMGVPEGTSWVLKFQRPITAPIWHGNVITGYRQCIYGCGSDRRLRPVSGLKLDEDITTDTPIKELA